MHKRRSDSGMGLVEVLVAGMIGAMVMFGISRMMKMSFDGARRADVKNEFLNLETRVRNLLAEEETCRAVLVDPLKTKTFAVGATDAFNKLEGNITLKFSDGGTLEDGGKYQDFKIGHVSLKLLGAIPPESGGRYEANFVIDPRTDTGGRQLAGGELKDRTIPLVLTTTLGTDNVTRTITGCFLAAADGRKNCLSMGGRWLSEPLSRCFFGGDLKLNQYECVNPSDFGPNGALEGASVQTCYYHAAYYSTRMSQYQCINYPNSAYPSCLCREGKTAEKTGWQLYREKTNTFYRPCEGGVMIRVPDEKSIFLKENEIYEGKFITDATPSVSLDDFMANWDLQNSVSDCYYDGIGDSVRAFRCNQERAQLGLSGSCIFVNGAHYATGGAWKEGYTGWMRVYYNRALVLKGPKNNYWTAVQEASGIRCQYVKAIADAEAAPLKRWKNTDDPNPVIRDSDNWSQVKECLFLGGNTATDVNPVPVFTKPYANGSYLNRYPCGQGDIDPDKLVGIDEVDPVTKKVIKETPSLLRGSCWYFTNVKLRAQFEKNKYPEGGSTDGITYTGWMYLRDPLPDGYFVADADRKVTNAKPYTLNAVPCNVGVRITDDGGAAP